MNTLRRTILTERFSEVNVEQDDLSRRDEWARHYDVLLWTVTGILLAMDGALLVVCSDPQSYHTALAIGGLWLAVANVHFAASFRELRQRVVGSDPSAQFWQAGRRLYQWEWFVGIILFVEAAWSRLLWSHWHVRPIYLWLVSGGAVLVTLWDAWQVRGRRGKERVTASKKGSRP